MGPKALSLKFNSIICLSTNPSNKNLRHFGNSSEPLDTKQSAEDEDPTPIKIALNNLMIQTLFL